MPAKEAVDIETIGTRLVYENRWMRVREDAIRRRDGSSGIFSVVEKPDFVMIVPLADDGRLHLVQQYQTHRREKLRRNGKAAGRGSGPTASRPSD